jgi:hypothetical protein
VPPDGLSGGANVTQRLPKSCEEEAKIRCASADPKGDTRDMDQGKDSELTGRFCWPAQDRARANSPLAAPRISPVFTASVYFSLVTPVPAPLHSSLSSVLPPLSRAAASEGWQNRLGQAVVCGCYRVGSPEQSALFRRSWRQSPCYLEVHEVAIGRGSNLLKGEIALGWRPSARFISFAAQTTRQFIVPSPDWRIMGEQDQAETP